MKTFANKFLTTALVLLVLSSCVKQPETIVVDDSPETPKDTLQQEDTVATTEPAADFNQLVIGEIHSITTLDPLFADNNSARRTLQILFEGLVRYNQEGEIIPAIAKRWSIGQDSLRYQFILRDDIYYHDSEVFNNGVGRKMVADDVKFAFERMARNTVPDDAAQLFMGISGFESYFREQHNILNPAYRELNGVRGIQVSNDTTLSIILAEKDPHFLQKLASPYALIYPKESVKENPKNFAPVGSGPYQLSQQVGDSVYIFAKNQEYRSPKNDIPTLDRVDVVTERNEQNMLKALGSRTIHVVPELGPQIVSNIINEDGNLNVGYSGNYSFIRGEGTTTYSLLYHPGSATPEKSVRSVLSGINPEQLTQKLPNKNVELITSPDTTLSTGDSLSTIYSTYPDDPYQQWFLQRLVSQWNGQPQLQILKIRTPTRHTALYTSTFVPFYPQHMAPDRSNLLIRYKVNQSVLSIKEVKQLHFNRYPWWIDLREVDMPGIDNL